MHGRSPATRSCSRRRTHSCGSSSPAGGACCARTFSSRGYCISTPRRIKLGVVTDEFFDPRLGRLGGFGWAARQLARIFNGDPSLGVELVYVAGELFAEPGRLEAEANGSRVLLRRHSRLENLRAMQREKFDLLLTIDYNLGYSVFLRSLPRTPAIVWVRDPRTPEDAEKINGLRIPGTGDATPEELMSHDGRSLATIA